jgi:hypothetical protein
MNFPPRRSDDFHFPMKPLGTSFSVAKSRQSTMFDALCFGNVNECIYLITLVSAYDYITKTEQTDKD